MKLFCLSVLFCVFASVSAAAPVVIRTGEHQNFSRVVIFFPAETEWELGRDERGYVMRTSVTDGFQLEQFFDLIPRTRISEVSQDIDTGKLFLALDCVCHAKASLLGEQTVVLDIIDGPASRISATELGLAAPDLGERQSMRVQRDQQIPDFDTRILPLIIDPNQHIEPLVMLDQSRDSQIALEKTTTESDTITRFEDEVLQALGQGMSGRLLTEDLSLGDTIGASRPGDSIADLAALPGVNARTSVDPLAVLSGSDGPQTQTGDQCLPDIFFDIQNWGDDQSFGVQIGEARMRVFQEFDLPDEDAVTALAQTFIFFGFGKEALQALELDQAQSRQRLYLAAIARIIDGEYLTTSLFEGQVSCASTVALWAVLASSDAVTDASVERNSVLRAFKELPIPLQLALGPRLSRIFLRLGDLEASQQILQRSQSDGVDVSENAMAQGLLSTALQGPGAGAAALSDVVDTSARTTPVLMTQYFEEKLDSGAQFLDEDFILADALRFEAQGSDEYALLVAAQVRGYLAANQFAQARRLLSTDAAVLSVNTLRDLEQDLARQAVARMPDALFGQFVWSRELVPGTPELVMEFAMRLDQMGFPDEAAELRTQAQDDLQADSSLMQVAGDGTTLVEPNVEIPNVQSEASGPARSDSNTVPVALGGVTLRSSRAALQASRQQREDFLERLEAVAVPES